MAPRRRPSSWVPYHPGTIVAVLFIVVLLAVWGEDVLFYFMHGMSRR